MKLYVARHGQTRWNSQNRVLGRTDIPLNETGIEQAKGLAEKAASLGIDIIISSPLKRARQTADIVGGALGLNVLADDRLIEFDFGAFEGASRDDAEYQRLKRQFCSKYENGESVLAVAARVYPFLDEIRVKYRDKTVLLVCHNAMMRVINAYFTAPNNDEFFDFAVGNCETVFYET